MRVYFFTPLPLALHISELRQRNAAYYLLNRHWLFYLIRRILPYIHPISLFDTDSKGYADRIHWLKTRIFAAMQKHDKLLRLLTKLAGLEFVQTPEVGNDSKVIIYDGENKQAAAAGILPEGMGLFAESDIRETNAAGSARIRFQNAGTKTHVPNLPPPSPQPLIGTIPHAVQSSPLMLIPVSGLFLSFTCLVAMLAEAWVFEKVLEKGFKLTQSYSFRIPFIGIIVIKKAFLAAAVIPVASQVIGYYLNEYVLGWLRKAPTKLFKRVMLAFIVAACFIFLGNGTLYYRNVSQENRLKRILTMTSRISELMNNEVLP